MTSLDGNGAQSRCESLRVGTPIDPSLLTIYRPRYIVVRTANAMGQEVQPRHVPCRRGPSAPNLCQKSCSVLCSVLQCVDVCCCVAVCCRVLQCTAVCCSVLQCVAVCSSVLLSVAVLQCVAMSQEVQQRHAPCRRCPSAYCSVSPCAAECCSVLQTGTAKERTMS